MEGQRNGTVLRVEGAFDLSAARLVEHTVKRLGAGEQVRIDFTRVRQFHDFGIARLAQVLLRHSAVTVKLEGLRMHQVRLLRYFGVDPDTFRPDGDDGRHSG